MDNSANMIDLMYLTNSKSFKSTVQNKTTVLYAKDDLKKYRTRIFEQTRDILTGKSLDKNIKAAFDEYIKLSIDNFKFLDKRDIIQQDYVNIKKVKKKMGKFDYNDANKLVYKNNKPTHIRITDCIPVKIKNKAKTKIIIPRQRDFSKSKSKTKGNAVKQTNALAPSKAVIKNNTSTQKVGEKDNIIIRYDEKKIKEKNEKKKKKT